MKIISEATGGENPPLSFAAALVAVESAAPSFDKAYSYLIPEDMRDKAKPGCRVQIPFGRADRKLAGLILSVGETEDAARLKPLLMILDDEPILNEEGLWLLSWLREHTFCTTAHALRTLIPAGLSIRKKISEDKIIMVRPVDAGGFDKALTARQREVYDFILGAGETPLSEVLEDTGASRSVVDKLVKLSAVERFTYIRPRNPYADLPEESPGAVLSSGQQKGAPPPFFFSYH
ncbi:MAG: hypothetical protein FWH00_01995 [Oscillospiraceae bacterium]|nr:hypothetical protein [Oscillospiraceae bacterium]